MTGTPGGCAIEISSIEKFVGGICPAKVRLKKMLEKGLKPDAKFLKPGDKVKATGVFCCQKDEIEVQIVEQTNIE